MNPKRLLLVRLLQFHDLTILILCFLGNTWQTYERRPMAPPHFSDFLAWRISVRNLLILIGLVWIWRTVFAIYGLYWSRRLSTFRAEAGDLIKATSWITLVLGLAGWVLRIELVTLPFLLAFWMESTLLLLIARFAMRQLLYWLRRRGRNLRHILVVGTNRRARLFARMIEHCPNLGYRLAGFADSDWEGLAEFENSGYQRVCSLEEVMDYLRRHPVDEVALCLPLRSHYARVADLIYFCDTLGVCVRYVSTIFERRQVFPSLETRDGFGKLGEAFHSLRLDNLDVVDLQDTLVYNDLPVTGQRLAKRALDIGVALLALLLLSPLLLLTALLIKLDSSGPVFFIQERVGHNRRPFRLCKFRTMVTDAERHQAVLERLNEADGAVFKIQNDPRVTRLGRFLRKTSIDELPQLFNVLRGEMSLVGPRPLPLRDYNRFEEDIHRRRFSIKPGITGLWQVSGRSNLKFDQWMRYDLQYIDEWSLLLDLKILFRTIPAVFKGEGAC